MPYQPYQGPGWAQAFIDARAAKQQSEANKQRIAFERARNEQLQEQQRIAQLLPEARQYAAQGRPEMLGMLAPDELVAMERADVAREAMAQRRKSAEEKEKRDRELNRSRMALGILSLAKRNPASLAGSVGQLRQLGIELPDVGPEGPQPSQLEELEAQHKLRVATLGSPKAGKILTEVLPMHGYTTDAIGAALQNPNVINDLRQAWKREQSKGPEKKDVSAPLRKEFQALQTIKEANLAELMIGKIRNTSPNAAGDLSLVFAYMKMLDPGSVVREGEQALARNAAGVPEVIRTMYNRVASGETLSPEQRQRFKEEADKLLVTYRQRFNVKANEYRRLATQQGIDPKDVVLYPGWSAEKLMGDLSKRNTANNENETKAITDGRIVRFIGSGDPVPAGWKDAD
jgi:hypothetical protein